MQFRASGVVSTGTATTVDENCPGVERFGVLFLTLMMTMFITTKTTATLTTIIKFLLLLGLLFKV
jgi:hypothetical protein